MYSLVYLDSPNSFIFSLSQTWDQNFLQGDLESFSKEWYLQIHVIIAMAISLPLVQRDLDILICKLRGPV